ncbi:MAG: BlaI/MecI/CopY family transcriptional regulator [Actinobacteria bacterium]|nr:BlaI/MecI/CopY family transcriptional regulator [Actinomycetota bacterium]
MRRLGDLEAAVMDRLWVRDRAVSVREVLEDLNQDRALAYTTVMTVLDNLHRKGLVTRTQSGRAYLYVPVRSRAEHAADLIAGVLEQTADRTVPLLHFVQSLTPQEMHRLRTALDASTGADLAASDGAGNAAAPPPAGPGPRRAAARADTTAVSRTTSRGRAR